MEKTGENAAARKKIGILFMVLSSLSFALMQMIVSASKRIPTMEQVFFRNMFVLFVSYLSLRRRQLPLLGDRKYWKPLFGRCFFGFLGLISLFYAASHAAQGDVAILAKLAPVFVTFFSALFLHEKLSKIQIPALLLSIAGAALVFRPSFHSNPFPLFVVVFEAACTGVAYTFLSYFKGRVDGMSVIFAFSAFSVLASLPFAGMGFILPTLTELLLLLLIGVSGSLGQTFVTYAYRYAPASEISIYDYTGIIFSLILGFLFLGEGIRLYSFLGGMLVILASLLSYWYNRRKTQ